MKIYLLILVLVCIIFYAAEARKKDKWAKKSKLDYFGDENELAKSVEKSHGTHNFNKNYKHKNREGMGMPMSYNKKMKHHKKGKHGYKQLSWLNIKKGSDCEPKCEHGEVCIAGPIAIKPLCVRKKDLKKSMKLFRRYEKKEMKAWKKFQKERYNINVDDEKYGEDVRRAELKMEFIKTQDPKTSDTHLALSAPPDPVEQNDECLTDQFSQMRSRLMGWFHLLHGQDHLAKKAHGGNIKHFYKHVSVKKELREHNGNKCECLKSAMWQFHQMDKDGDDHLNAEEIAVLGENSLEPCLKPYLTSCDTNADQKFSSDEWCCCFSNVVAPCFKKVDEIRKSGEPVVYMPRCDKEGYYMREQCSGDSEDTYQCWCVDYNGNEYKDTRKPGRAHCTKAAMYGAEMTPMI